MKRKRKIGLFGAVAAIGVAASLGMAAAQENSDPAPPSWVNSDGTVDANNVPNSLPLVGPNGEFVRDLNGTVVTVPFNTTPAIPAGH